jgi:hypothetical protein
MLSRGMAEQVVELGGVHVDVPAGGEDAGMIDKNFLVKKFITTWMISLALSLPL